MPACLLAHPNRDLMNLRVAVLELFMRSGSPPEKVDIWRPFFHTVGIDVLAQALPLVIGKEDSTLLKEIAGQLVSTTFDSTARHGDVLNNVLR